MSKYLILFNSTLSGKELMDGATPEQMQASMNDWVQWQQKASKTIIFEWGMPLQAAALITSGDISDSKNPASGYCIIEGDKEVVSKLLQTHPHLNRDGATIDTLEMLSMSGME